MDKRQTVYTITQLQNMGDYEFEHFIADLWEHQSWSTEVEKQAGDAGIDVRATKTNPYEQKILIQAKRYSDGTKVSGPDIQQYASLKHQEANVDQVIVVTTSEFTSAAKNRARDLNVKIVNGNELVSLIKQHNAEHLLEKYSSDSASIATDRTKSNHSAEVGDNSTNKDNLESSTIERIYTWLRKPANSEREVYGEPIPNTIWLNLFLLSSIASGLSGFYYIYYLSSTEQLEYTETSGEVTFLMMILIFTMFATVLTLYVDIEEVLKYCDWNIERRLYLTGIFLTPYFAPLVALLYYRRRQEKSKEAEKEHPEMTEGNEQNGLSE